MPHIPLELVMVHKLCFVKCNFCECKMRLKGIYCGDFKLRERETPIILCNLASCQHVPSFCANLCQSQLSNQLNVKDFVNVNGQVIKTE